MASIFDAIKNGLGGLLGGKKKPIISPIPKNDVLDTPGKLNYVALDQSKQDMAARNAKIVTPTPTAMPKSKPVNLAVASPKKQVKGVSLSPSKPLPKKDRASEVIQTIRAERPQYKGSDDQIRQLYKKHGEGLLSEIIGSKQKILAAPVTTSVAPTKTSNAVYRSGVAVQPNPNEQISPDFQRILNEVIFPITDAAGIPRALAAAQAATEGGRAQSQAAQELKNYYGIMRWDQQGNRSLRPFSNPSESVDSYVNTVKKLVPDINSYDDDIMAAEALQSGTQRYEGDNQDIYDYVRTLANTPEFRKYARVRKKKK